MLSYLYLAVHNISTWLQQEGRSVKLVLHYVTFIQMERGQDNNNQSSKTIFDVCTIVPDLEVGKLQNISVKNQNRTVI